MGKPAIDDTDEEEAVEPGTGPLDDDWGNPEAFEQDMDGEEEEADFEEDELEEEDDDYSDTDLGYDDL